MFPSALPISADQLLQQGFPSSKSAMTRHPESHQEIIPIPTKVNELNKGLEKV